MSTGGNGGSGGRGSAGGLHKRAVGRMQPPDIWEGWPTLMINESLICQSPNDILIQITGKLPRPLLRYYYYYCCEIVTCACHCMYQVPSAEC
jgi:hypothetical protein